MKRSYYLKRIIPCALVILACLFVVIMSMEATGFTDTQRMRLAERAQLVGPSDIVGSESGLPVWGDVLIGQSFYGYTVFSCDSEEVFYHRKAENFTTFSPTELPNDFWKEHTGLPVFAFTENSSGTHAKLTARIFTLHSGELKEYPFSAEAQRSENGYFLFELPLEGCRSDTNPDILTEMLNQQVISYPLTYGTITLELYDSNGTLLETHTRNCDVLEAK